MDRHDIPEVTPEALAAAHAKDVEIESEYGVKYLTYWHDPARGAIFCLAQGPDRDSVEAVHRNSHGLMAANVIDVDERMVSSFLGAILEPQVGEPFTQTAFRAIMFTDIVGSTELTSRLGDARAQAVLRAHDTIIRNVIGQHGGTEVKHTGDGIMASFTSAPGSVEAAVAIQRQMHERNDTVPDPLHIRIGISAGEPVTEAGDLFGAAVQLAARVCSACDPGGILVTPAVRELSLGRTLRFLDRGLVELKGFAEPTRMYTVEVDVAIS